MVFYVFPLTMGKQVGRHILVLDPHIGKKGRRQRPVQIHGLVPFKIFPCDPVVGLKQLLKLLFRHGAEPFMQPFCPVQKHRKAAGFKHVTAFFHFLCGGNNDLHQMFSLLAYFSSLRYNEDIRGPRSAARGSGSGTGYFRLRPGSPSLIIHSQNGFVKPFCAGVYRRKGETS